MALVQSVRDVDRAHQNFLNALAKHRKVGRRRYKSRKDSRQSFRLIRNGFTVRPTGRLFLAKIGEVRVRWSRPLPSEPSSVTIIREPDGHYHASFVVDVSATPMPVLDREAGVDFGLNIVGLVKNRRLARSIHDAAWRQFVRLLVQKAELYGRSVTKVSRWLPSSKCARTVVT